MDLTDPAAVNAVEAIGVLIFMVALVMFVSAFGPVLMDLFFAALARLFDSFVWLVDPSTRGNSDFTIDASIEVVEVPPVPPSPPIAPSPVIQVEPDVRTRIIDLDPPSLTQ